MIELVEPVLCAVVVKSYVGATDPSSGLYMGHGVASMDNQCTYEGQFRNGMFHGKGKYTWANGVVFEGEFDRALMTGKGSYKWTDGSTYDGIIENGKRHGKGVFKCSGGQIYDGFWCDGKKHGEGKMIYNEEKTIVYVGGWKDGLRDGYGQMKYASGNSYEGEWKEGKKCGRGVMVWREVDEVYTGDWANDLPHGYGEHIWGDGGSKSLAKHTCNIYRGEWVKGLRHGYGTFFYANGSQYTGCWENNQKHGEGVFIHPDGKLFVGSFERDRMNAGDEHVRTSDDVSPQASIYISDVLRRYPSAALSAMATPAQGGQVQQRKTSTLTSTLTLSQSVDGEGPKPSEIDGDSSDAVAIIASQTGEIERLLLRYNSFIRAYYKRSVETAQKRRVKEQIQSLSAADPYVASWPKLEQAMFQARALSKRLFCMSLEQARRFFRETSLFGPDLSSFDLSTSLRRMRTHRINVAKQLQYSKRCAMTKKELVDKTFSECPPIAFAKDKGAASIASFMDHSFLTAPIGGLDGSDLSVLSSAAADVTAGGGDGDPGAAAGERETPLHPTFSADCDPRQPILEWELCELLVRCVAEVALREGARAGKLPKALYQDMFKALSTRVQPLCTDFSSVPPVVAAFYADSVQDMLRCFSPTILRHSWSKLVSQYREKGAGRSSKDPVVQIRQLVSFVLDLRGDAIRATATPHDVLVVLGPPSTPSNAAASQDLALGDFDFSWVNKMIDFDDFLSYFVRVVMSDLWVFRKDKKEVNSSMAFDAQEPSEEEKLSQQSADLTAADPAPNEIGVDPDEEGMNIKEIMVYRLSVWFHSMERRSIHGK